MNDPFRITPGRQPVWRRTARGLGDDAPRIEASDRPADDFLYAVSTTPGTLAHREIQHHSARGHPRCADFPTIAIGTRSA